MVISFFKLRKAFYFVSAFAVLLSVFTIAFLKLNFSIEFTGGTVWEIEYLENRPEIEILKEKLSSFNLGKIEIQPVGENRITLKTKEITQEIKEKILESFNQFGKVREIQFEKISPSISKELKEKSLFITIFSILAIAIYITLAFKNLSSVIPPFQCALGVIICVLHDLILPLGIFSLLGKFYGAQISIPVVIAFLTIAGYSINNIVVVYDRIREIVQKFPKKPLHEVVDIALNQTLSRQINTSLTTLFPLISIFLIIGEALKYFSLVLILGILIGTYSSIFLAGPILVSLRETIKNK